MFGLSRKQVYMIESGTYRIVRYVDESPSILMLDMGINVLSFDSQGYLIDESVVVRKINKNLASVTFVNWHTGKLDMVKLSHDEIMHTFESFVLVEQIK